ncbi:MAG: D-tyrosyl-tRNA(Tyr) deacylase [Elusimicrobia bacterium]|nr:D-tyrosyl-tRNA(Tyr) deacylase [Elusimicrobiota bacterium]
MRALLQRVSRASVSWPGGETRAIGPGLLLLLGVGKGDSSEHAKKLADKIASLRIFSNAEGKFDHCVLDDKGSALVVSQFTLYAALKGGRRPDFAAAAAPGEAKELYERFCAELERLGIPVKTGEFAAHMAVESVNDGPVTIWLDTEFF